MQDHNRKITEIFDELSVVGDNIFEEDRVVVTVTLIESNAEVQ